MSLRRGLAVWVLLCGCTPSTPTDALTYVERVELLGVLGDGAVLDARVTLGNGGLLRGQGRVEVDHWPRAGEPIRYARWSAPEATQRDAAGRTFTFDTDQLRGSKDVVESWHLRARSDEANAVIQVQGRGQAIEPVSRAAPKGTWSVGAPVSMATMQGWFEAGERGGKLDGYGVVLHRGGDGRPGAGRRAVFVMSDDLHLGLDEQGPVTLKFGQLDGRSLDLSAARITVEEGQVGIDLRPAEDLAVRLVATSAHGRTDRTAHWTPPEQWAAALMGGRTERTVVAARVEPIAGSLPEVARRGLIVWMDPAPLELPDRTVQRPQKRKRQKP